MIYIWLFLSAALQLSALSLPNAQQPLALDTSADQRVALKWTDPPNPDSTSSLVFNSVYGALKQWTNVLYRNGESCRVVAQASAADFRCHVVGLGHSIIPGYITPGTLIYHGNTTNETHSPPVGPEWAAFDPETAYMYGARVMTWQVVEPLKILYFDGCRCVRLVADRNAENRDRHSYLSD